MVVTFYEGKKVKLQRKHVCDYYLLLFCIHFNLYLNSFNIFLSTNKKKQVNNDFIRKLRCHFMYNPLQTALVD